WYPARYANQALMVPHCQSIGRTVIAGMWPVSGIWMNCTAGCAAWSLALTTDFFAAWRFLLECEHDGHSRGEGISASPLPVFADRPCSVGGTRETHSGLQECFGQRTVFYRPFSPGTDHAGGTDH